MRRSSKFIQIVLEVVTGLLLMATMAGYLLFMPTATAFAQPKTPIPTKMADVTVAAVPAKETVSQGEEFDLLITISTDLPSRGVQFEMKWDPAFVEVLGFSEGDFYKSWAESVGGSTLVIPEPTWDNERGVFSTVGIAILGAAPGTGGANGSGTLMTIHAKAKEREGTAEFILENVIVSDEGTPPVEGDERSGGVTQMLGGVKTQSGLLAIGSEAVALEQPAAEAVPTATQPPKLIQPTLEPIVRTPQAAFAESAEQSGGAGFNNILLFGIPVVGAVVIGLVVFLTTRKK